VLEIFSPHAADRGDDVVDADAEGRLEVDKVEVFRAEADVEPVGREELRRQSADGTHPVVRVAVDAETGVRRHPVLRSVIHVDERSLPVDARESRLREDGIHERRPDFRLRRGMEVAIEAEVVLEVAE
jgi:hypothetical protein